MTIQEYATSRNITYEAARQAINKAMPEIEKYIHKQGRTRHLTPDGEQLLDKRRKNNRITSLKKESADKSEKIEEQSDTIDKLKNEIIILQKQLLEERTMRLESAEKVARLEAIADTRKHQEEQIDRLQAEIDTYRPFCFGLYRKKKIKPSAEVSHEEKYIFPENWEENYIKWKNQEITTDEFIDRSGVEHRGTFYNMIKAYKKQKLEGSSGSCS